MSLGSEQSAAIDGQESDAWANVLALEKRVQEAENRICMQALDGGQQFCCTICNAMCCFKCLLSYISTNKLDCINRCFHGNQDAVKFCKPHTYIMCMQESAKIKCHECGLILANADAFKKHVCQKSISIGSNSLAEKLAQIKLAEKRAD